MKQLKDRVLEVSQTQGTGDYALAGAVTGFRAFSPAVNVGDTADYYAEEVDGTGVPSGAWETGMGTYAAGNKLQRTTIYASSNGGTPINWGVGTRRVAISLTSQTLADAVNSAEIASGYVAAANAAKVAAQAAATASASSASTSATSASQSAAARDAAIAAWAASTAPAEQLAAISQSLHVGDIVKAIIYDTSKDSDGGAWRKRCADKSWYTETLGGDRWIGQQATIAAAWTAAGSVTGAVYQASATAGSQTSGLYYTPTSSTTVTQVYRGVTREFPAVAGIVAESGRVVIYDLATGAMWMVFTGSGGTLYGTMLGRSGCPRTALAALNGRVVSGGNAGMNYGEAFSWFDFTSDSARMGVDRFNQPISGRNSSVTPLAGVYAALGSYLVNDVAITVLDGAPIDPATGLPVPTIAVGMPVATGVSVIKDDSTVSTPALTYAANNVGFDKLGNVVFLGENGRNIRKVLAPAYSTVATLSGGGAGINSGINVLVQAGNFVNKNAMVARALIPGTTAVNGILTFKENYSDFSKSMAAAITKDYSSGWMVGYIRGAWLADTTAETITASGELVTNGDFATNTSGWTASNNTTLTWDAAGAIQVAPNALNGNAHWAYQSFPTVVGKTYRASVKTNSALNADGLYLRVGSGSIVTSTGIIGSATPVVGSVVSVDFIAANSTTTVAIGVDDLDYPTTPASVIFDDVSVKLAEPDRSVKNKGVIVNGSLTKTAVASGAGLVAYSGFSGSNYLEQPYSSNLDFGAGDFCVMGWVYNAGTDHSILHRGPLGVISGNGVIDIWTYETNNQIKAVFAGVQLVVTAAGNSNHFVVYIRTGGILYGYVDGVLVGSIANTNSMTLGTLDSLYIGKGYYSTALAGGVADRLALWRISATAPSADQIAHIYRTELPLFQAGAQCTIAGTSTAVTALAYDDVADTLHVGTSWGRSGFKDLLRVDSETTTTGGTTSLSANQGAILTGGSSGKYYQPALLLRDELRRKDEARKAMGRVQVALDFTATAAQTAFVCTKGYDVRSVYANGLLKRVGTDYTVSDDGFKKTVTFTAGQLVGVPVTAMLTRA